MMLLRFFYDFLFISYKDFSSVGVSIHESFFFYNQVSIYVSYAFSLKLLLMDELKKIKHEISDEFDKACFYYTYVE